MVYIKFERETVYGIYRDAITLSDDHTLTDAQIQALMQQRADDWVRFVENPPVVDSPEIDSSKH